jgi:hypothetical protein
LMVSKQVEKGKMGVMREGESGNKGDRDPIPSSRFPLMKWGNPETGWAILKDDLPVLKLGSGENHTAEDEVGQEESPENVKDLRSQEGDCRPSATHLEQIGETSL